MFTPHPNLSPEINQAFAESELQGGVWLIKPEGDEVKDERYLPTGKTLKVQTKNTLYIIEKRGDNEFYISGSEKYCPVPVRAYIRGSTWGGSMLKVSWVGRGMYVEFSLADNPRTTITTSMVQEITEI